jgi:hypothetical protein
MNRATTAGFKSDAHNPSPASHALNRAIKRSWLSADAGA